MSKKNFILYLLLVVLFSLEAIEIPFSDKVVKSDSNVVKDFYRTTPNDKAVLADETEVWFWHDKKNLYIQAECSISDNFSLGTYCSRDKYNSGDMLLIELVTNLNDYSSYNFRCMPCGGLVDGIRDNKLNCNFDWNSSYSYITNVEDDVWTCKITIPFSDLTIVAKDGTDWRINVSRYYEKSGHQYFSPYVNKETMKLDYYRKSEKVKIIGEISEDKVLDVIPYYTQKYDVMSEEFSEFKDNYGFDVRYKPNSTINVKFTYNPDFSDVPMDIQSDNYNSRYQPYYPENRYFFLDDVFTIDDCPEYFNTREIVKPVIGLKLYGNSENLSWSILSAKDKLQKTTGVIFENDDLFNAISITPKWKNFSLNTNIISRTNDDYYNYVLMMNPSIVINSHNSLDFVIESTYKKNDFESANKWRIFPENVGKAQGYAGSIQYAYNNEKIQFFTGISSQKDDYFNDSAYVSSDQRNWFNYYARLNHQRLVNDNQILKYIDTTTDFSISRKFDKDTFLYSHLMQEIVFHLVDNIHFTTKANLVRENYVDDQLNDNIYNYYEIMFGLDYNKYRFCSFGINVYPQNKYLIYNLQDVYKRDKYFIYMCGNITKYFYYFTNYSYVKNYDVDKKSDYYDDAYDILNLSLQYNYTKRIHINSGVRWNNQEYWILDYDSNNQLYHKKYQNNSTGLYCNVNYNVWKELEIYSGYQYSVTSVNGSNRENFNNYYIKLRYNFKI